MRPRLPLLSPETTATRSHPHPSLGRANPGSPHGPGQEGRAGVLAAPPLCPQCHVPSRLWGGLESPEDLLSPSSQGALQEPRVLPQPLHLPSCCHRSKAARTGMCWGWTCRPAGQGGQDGGRSGGPLTPVSPRKPSPAPPSSEGHGPAGPQRRWLVHLGAGTPDRGEGSPHPRRGVRSG